MKRLAQFQLNLQKRGLIIVLLITVLVSAACVMPTATPSPTPFPNHRRIVSSTLSLREIWRVKNNDYITSLLGTDQGLVYSTMTSDKQVVLLDDQSGQVRWQVKRGDRNILVLVSAADEERFYFSEISRIYAYRLVDGQPVWQFDTGKNNRAHVLSLGNKDLWEYERPARDGNVIRRFDPAAGTLLETETLPFPVNVFICKVFDNSYLVKTGDHIQLIERGTNHILWEKKLAGCGSPVKANRLLLWGDGLDLLAFEFESGKFLWRQDKVAVSNPVVRDNLTYVIAPDASIRAYALKDGREVGRIILEPALILPERQGSYVLRAGSKDEIIYAYYGDSEEIIAFDQ